ncbi:MAG: efflux RND transporter periplasmic adaptor subunit [Acidiphilium sp.]|nr:efflux RND transporter periplasmic adaptor subunit [Acidiphilium sp.]MDD4936692.1 efflux RND transporter periplasmic adaptor subunit [Acidiphilium sp.]
MKRSLIIVVCAAALLFGGVFGLHAYQQKRVHNHLAASANPDIVVSAAPVTTVSHASETSAVGQIMAVQGASIGSAVGGVVETVDFHSGMTVKAHQTLITLNAGALPGQLEQAQAKAHLAAIDATRQRGLYGVKGTSQANYDTAKYTLQSDIAAVHALKQALAQYTITAPFAGVVGLRTLDAGAYVHPGDMITDLENLHELYVDFSIPQKDVSLIHLGAPVTIMVHQGDTTKRVTAHVTAFDSHISKASRAMSVRAVVHHHEGLFPGMFTMVTIQSTSPVKVVTVPMVAVSFNTFGDFVYVVQKKTHGLVAVERPVTVGSQFDGRVEVLSGLKPGMQIVTAGQVKLHSGDPVKINNAVSLEARS